MGAQMLADVEKLCAVACAAHGFKLDFRQTNHEGVLVDWLQENGRAQAAGRGAGVILSTPGLPHQRRPARRHQGRRRDADRAAHQQRACGRRFATTAISPVARAVMAGFGVQGYPLAIAALAGI